MTKEELQKYIEDRVKETADEYIAAQLKEQIQDALGKFTPSKEEEEVNKAAKEKKFKSFGEFLTAVYNYRQGGQHDERLVYVDSSGKIASPPESKTMTEGTDSAGGFLVFEEYKNQIFQIGLEKAIVRANGAMIIPMSSDTINIPRVEDTSHASSVFGGVVAYWEGETSTMTASEPKWGNCKLTAHQLAGYTKASNALLADAAIGLESFIRRAFGEAWAYYEDVAFISGLGGGEPLGILNAPCTITVTRQANNKVYYNDLVNMWSRLLPSSQSRAIWLLNPEVLPELMKMGAGNAAQASGHNLVWINRDQGAAKSIPGTIFGRPFFVTEKMSALGSEGDIGVFDFGYYLIGDRQTLTIDASTHVYFTTNCTAWRFVLRVDGQPWLASPITPRNGSNTLSPFVTLSSTS